MSGPLAGFVTSVATANPARAMTSAIRQRHPSRTYRYRQGWRQFSRRPRRLGTGPARTRSPRHRYYGFRVLAGPVPNRRGRREPDLREHDLLAIGITDFEEIVFS